MPLGALQGVEGSPSTREQSDFGLVYVLAPLELRRAGSLTSHHPMRQLNTRSERRLFSDPALSQLSDGALAAYEEARISGLCHEGAWEIAVQRDRGDRLAGDRVTQPDAKDRSEDADD